MSDADGARVLLLGPVAVDVGGTTTALRSPQQALFLALLAHRPGHALSTDDILERAWSGQPPPSARAAVRVQMARLRTALRTGAIDPLPHTARGYALEPRVVRTDVEDLHELVEALAATHTPDEKLRLTEEALGLWRGAPAVRDYDDEGLRIEAQRLDEVRLDLQDAHTDALLALGHHTPACHDLVALVASEPLRERRTRQLMLALYRGGRQADALATCRELRDRLADELGVDPSSETVALELAILRQDPALVSGVPGSPGTAARGVPVSLSPPPEPGSLPAPTPQLAMLVDERLALLEVDARRWVLKAALLDEHAALPVLADALDMPLRQVERLARQATRAGLVRPGVDGVLHLRPEVRDTLLVRADTADLGRACRGAGQALARHHGDLGALVRAAWLVVRGAGDWDDIGPVVHRALNSLRSADARGAGADLCAAAIPLAPDAGARADLLIRRTRALIRAGRAREADATWSRAVDEARASGDPERFALAVLAEDWTHRSLAGPPGSAAALLREALDRLGPRPSALRVSVLSYLIQELVTLPRERSEVPSLAAEVERQGAELGDPYSLATVLLTGHVLLRGGPELARRAQLADRLAVAAADTPEPERWMPRLWGARLVDAYAAGDLRAVPDLAHQLLAGAQALQSPRLVWYHALARASLHRDRGEFAEADEWADQGAILGASAGIPDALPAAALHRLLTLFLTSSLAPMAPRIKAFLDRSPDTTMARSLLAVALAQAGEPDEASTVLEGALSSPRGVPAADDLPVTLGAAADAVVLLGRTDLVGRLTAELLPYAGQWLVFGQGAATWGPADRCLGLLAWLSGDTPEAIRWVRRGRAQADSAVALAWVARCDADLAHIG